MLRSFVNKQTGIQGSLYTTRRYTPLQNTISFRLFLLSSIALYTPVISVTMRGYLGYLPLVLIAFLALIMERASHYNFQMFIQTVRHNKLYTTLAIWYFLGVVLNQYYYLGLLSNWRLLLSSMGILFGIFFSLYYGYNPNCRRITQIIIILFSGFQASFSTNTLLSQIGIARNMWLQSYGAWIHGNQAFYSIIALMIPVFFWRASLEKGFLKLLLYLASILSLIYSVIGTFGTPIGIIIIHIICITILSFVLIFLGKRKFRSIAYVGFLILIMYWGQKYVLQLQVLEDAISRIENVIEDPRSGGYSQELVSQSRWYLAQKSFISFWSNPLLGAGGGTTQNNPNLGGHSSFFDSLGAYGLLGGGGAIIGIVLLMIFQGTIYFLRQRNMHSIIVFSTSISLLAMGIANPYWGSTDFFLIMSILFPFSQELKK